MTNQLFVAYKKPKLTPLEESVYKLANQGYSEASIASQLNRSERAISKVWNSADNKLKEIKAIDDYAAKGITGYYKQV